MEVLDLSVRENRERLMLADVELLYREERFTSCCLLIMCFLDALASPGKDRDKGAFQKLLGDEFRPLCEALRPLHNVEPSALIYDRYRNGLSHGLGPKPGFAMCRDAELEGRYAGAIAHPSANGTLIGLNVDRLFNDFCALLRRRAAV